MSAKNYFFSLEDFSDFEGLDELQGLDSIGRGKGVEISLGSISGTSGSRGASGSGGERRRWRGVKDPSSPEIRLENAVLLGRWQEVKFLIEAGVDVSHCDNWILRMATFAGETDMVRFLVERGADPLAMKPSEVKQAAQITHSALSKVGARAKLGMSPASPSRTIERESPVRFSLSAPAYMM